MKTRTALVALLIALAAAAAAWFVLKQSAKPPALARTWLSSLNSGQVDSITVTTVDGQTSSIERCAVPETWVLHQQPATGAPPPLWPVAGPQVRGALRLIADIDATAPTDGAAPKSGTTLLFKFKDGSTHQLVLSDASLGGKTLVSVQGPPDSLRLVDAGLAKMFEAGLRAWRQGNALSANSPDADNPGEISRIHLQTVGRQLTLGKTGARWGIQAPVPAPADQGACGKLQQALTSIQIHRIVDETLPDTATGLSTPTAMVETESDFRLAAGAEVTRRTLIQKITVGGPADPTGKMLYARLQADWLDPVARKRDTVWGPVLVMVARGDFDAISSDITPFIARQAVQTPAADMAGLVIAPSEDSMSDKPSPQDSKASARAVRLTRTLDGWRYKPDQGELRVPSPAVVAHIDSAIRLLCEAPADAIGLEPPTGTTSAAMLSVDAGGPAQAIGVGVAQVTPAGKPAQPGIIIRTGPIFRVYLGPAAIDFARWLSDELPPEG